MIDEKGVIGNDEPRKPRIRKRRLVILAIFLLVAGYFARLWTLATPEQVLQAARLADWARVRRIVLIRPSSILAAQDVTDGKTPLLLAAAACNVEMVKFLVRRGVDTNLSDDTGMPPLHAVTMSGNLELVKYLLEQGAQLNRHDGRGRTALHIAAAEGHYRIAQHLLAEGADPNQLWSLENLKRPPYDTPLICALAQRQHRMVHLLLKAGANPNGRNNYRVCPLEIAISMGDEAMVSVLLDHGADPNAKIWRNAWSNESALLLRLAEEKAGRILELLRQHGAKESQPIHTDRPVLPLRSHPGSE